MASLFIVTLLATSLQLPPPTQRDAPPQRDTPPKAGTAIIRGRVTDREGGEPLARVVVTLTNREPQTNSGDRAVQIQTDDDGRYEFKRVAAGSYTLMFEPPEHKARFLAQAYGDSRPREMSRPPRPRPIEIHDGELIENANVTLARSLAIDGRVVDEFGDPLSGMEVYAFDADTSQRIYGGIPGQTMSDDRGVFRLFGLPPGKYVVCANPRFFNTPRVNVSQRYVKTCFPSAMSESDGQPTVVTTTDATGLEIRVQRGRAFNVTGSAFDSSGGPLQRGQINLVKIEKNNSSSFGIEVLGDGQFVAKGLTPGEYAIRAEIGSRFNPEDKREREVGYLPFRIDDTDLTLTVVTSKTAKIAGHVVFAETVTTRPTGPIRVMTRPDSSSPGMMMFGPPATAEVKEDLTFELSGLFGPQVITLTNAPRDWLVKSVRYNGRDITDVATEFKNSTDPRAVEIVLTSRGAVVTGRVIAEAVGAQPSAGQAAATPPEYRVTLIPADPSRWKPMTAIAGSGLAKPDGSFRVGPVRPGEYLILAMSVEEWPRGRFDAANIERLAKIAERVTLLEDDRREMELRVAKVQER